MAKNPNGHLPEDVENEREEERRDRHQKSKRQKEETIDGGDSMDEKEWNSEKKKMKRHGRSSKRSSKRRRHISSTRESDGDDSSSSSSDSYSDGSSGDSESEKSYSDESEEDRRRRRKKERRRKEREHERERRRRKEKERKRRKDKEEEKKKKRKDKKMKKKEKDLGKKGPVTNSWGKYGIIRETDMWNKRPEFTAWLAEVKQVNLESLPNWEEKQMFKEFMEDHNTATFPSKKYYDLDAYHCRVMVKELKKGSKKALGMERTVFNDEEQRRQELLIEREKQKEEQVEALKHSMQSGMAQAMKEQAQLKEEMAYQYKLGNFEVAAAIQRRLDPDVAM